LDGSTASCKCIIGFITDSVTGACISCSDPIVGGSGLGISP
jgi:hypothetical protein